MLWWWYESVQMCLSATLGNSQWTAVLPNYMTHRFLYTKMATIIFLSMLFSYVSEKSLQAQFQCTLTVCWTYMWGKIPLLHMIWFQWDNNFQPVPRWCWWGESCSESEFPYHMSLNRLTNQTTQNSHMYLSGYFSNQYSEVETICTFSTLTVATFWNTLDLLFTRATAKPAFITRGGVSTVTPPCCGCGREAASNTL